MNNSSVNNTSHSSIGHLTTPTRHPALSRNMSLPLNITTTTTPTVSSGHSQSFLIGLGLLLAAIVCVIVVILVCVLKRFRRKKIPGLGIPVNFKRPKKHNWDRAPLTTKDSDPTIIPDGSPAVYHDEEIIRRPLRSALEFRSRNGAPRPTEGSQCSLDEANESKVKSNDARLNHDMELGDFFSDEVYKKTDFSDSLTQQANADLSPGHDSGLDIKGLEELLQDDEFDFEWIKR